MSGIDIDRTFESRGNFAKGCLGTIIVGTVVVTTSLGLVKAIKSSNEIVKFHERIDRVIYQNADLNDEGRITRDEEFAYKLQVYKANGLVVPPSTWIDEPIYVETGKKIELSDLADMFERNANGN